VAAFSADHLEHLEPAILLLEIDTMALDLAPVGLPDIRRGRIGLDQERRPAAADSSQACRLVSCSLPADHGLAPGHDEAGLRFSLRSAGTSMADDARPSTVPLGLEPISHLYWGFVSGADRDRFAWHLVIGSIPRIG
jgi:hypothetical protein